MSILPVDFQLAATISVMAVSAALLLRRAFRSFHACARCPLANLRDRGAARPEPLKERLNRSVIR